MPPSRPAAFAIILLAALPAAAASQKIMVFDFYFDNTSMEATSVAENARIKKISNELRAALQASEKYEVMARATLHSLSEPQVGKCDDDELTAAQKAHAELVACPWVQKVSNLILNLNIVIENVKTGQFVQGGSVDIRGNTNESWEHGLRFLLREHVLGK